MEINEEQTMLLETAMSFCREKSPMTAVREGIAKVATHDGALWQEMVDLGWLSVAVPEEMGGLGMGIESTVPIIESMGRYLVSSPYLATTLAIHSIATSGSEAQQQRWLPALASGAIGTVALTETEGSWLLDEVACTATVDTEIRLSGKKCQVLDVQEADFVVVSVQIDGTARLVMVTREQLPRENICREVVIDETRRSYTLDLNGLTIDEDQVLPGNDFQAIEQAALLLLTAEMSGGMSAVLHVIVDYLTTRKQFDQFIGSYQALKHPTVDILLSEEGCKSHVYHAAAVMAEGDPIQTEVAVRMAKAQASEAFAYAGDRAVQFHGGFGFTYECDAQLFLRRALWCQHQFGDERHHRQMLAPLLLD
ncbi:MAG: acyl-CoA dehydrogenase family protein [Pseudomonadota bacterium]|nr:acyl-CoA dehydrogenase family protein [Pseudomonadota bacterium]